MARRKSRKFDWEEPKYSREEVNWAGKIISNQKKVSPSEEQKAIAIFENWRAAHNYPMHIFEMRLKKYSQKLNANCIVSQRLKRTPAILYKLGRRYNDEEPIMKLSQMQDIGGCRSVMPDVKLAKELFEKRFIKGELKHKRAKQKDYLINPKPDGYRGLHLVYTYHSDKSRKKFNGLKVEVQIRSKLQHLWATAVETIDFITEQALKFGRGRQEWSEFFLLVSSAFSAMEGYEYLDKTPQTEKELYLIIRTKEKELNAIEKLRAFTLAFKEYTEKKDTKKKAKFFLLELSMKQNDKKLIITEYLEKEKEKAVTEYGEKEKAHKGESDYDVVLVSVDDVKDLKKAYPKYFADTNDFIQQLNKIIGEYQS